jgi:hypothetical protein
VSNKGTSFENFMHIYFDRDDARNWDLEIRKPLTLFRESVNLFSTKDSFKLNTVLPRYKHIRYKHILDKCLLPTPAADFISKIPL